jgi:DNA-binding NtrC family response regulator
MADILIIDDDPAVRSVFTQLLESKGHRVRCAEEGREGMKLLCKQVPDLLITDILMPEMDGLEVLQHIRNHHAELPVIAISGGMSISSMNFLPLAERFGACRVFEKPVALEKLSAAVDELLS